MKGISTGLSVAALAVPAVAADPGIPGMTLSPDPPSSHSSQRDSQADDGTVAIVLGGVLLFVAITAPLFGAESRPAWLNVDRRASFRMVGSMRPEDWPPSEFKR